MEWKAVSVAVISDHTKPVRAALDELGCGRVVEAGDGDDAFALFAAGFAPDVVVIDWSGVRFDGLSVARRIRRTAALGRVAIMLISAHAEYGRVMAAREAGVNAFLLKPVTVGALATRIHRLLVPGKCVAWRPMPQPAGGRIAAGRAWFSGAGPARR